MFHSGWMAVYVAPLWATLRGVAFMGGRPGWPAFAALGLILGGVALASLERKPTVVGTAEA